MKAVTRKFLMLVAVFSMVMFFVANSYAAMQWYICKVNSIGRTGGGFNIKLTDTKGNFANKLFVIPPEIGKEFLAIGLTAISNRAYVSVYADPTTNSVIRMYLLTYTY